MYKEVGQNDDSDVGEKTAANTNKALVVTQKLEEEEDMIEGDEKCTKLQQSPFLVLLLAKLRFLEQRKRVFLRKLKDFYDRLKMTK